MPVPVSRVARELCTELSRWRGARARARARVCVCVYLLSSRSAAQFTPRATRTQSSYL